MKTSKVIAVTFALGTALLYACGEEGGADSGAGGTSTGAGAGGSGGGGGTTASGGTSGSGTGGSNAGGSAGTISTGGASGQGGTVGTGGRSSTTSSGGNPGTGGVLGTGGGSGGAAGTGGRSGTGGAAATGGGTGTGGTARTGGTTGTGGRSGTGGTVATGGAIGTGGALGTGGSTAGTKTHMYTQGSDLYAYCGEKVLLRGLNQMSVWTDPSGSSFPAIASFGSNVIRIVYEEAGTASGLDTLLAKAEANKMIPLPELHDATGNFSGVAATVNWWAQASVVAVIKAHEKWTLLNIANEAGDNNVSDATFKSTYTSAITTLRNAGITVPIVIDGSGWGQNVEQLLAVGPALLAADPQKNVIFSWHEYTGGQAQNARITTSYEQSKTLGIVLINGEFANGGVGDGCATTIPYKWLLAEAQRVGIGWLAWSWDTSNSDCKVGSSSIFNMTSNLTSASGLAAGWASDVVRDDPNSIKNTSVRHCEWK
jgi:mannan endo-1,4-beta-mannosidase